MQCSKCGKEFAPLNCPQCGGTISETECPACAEGGKVSCPGCGQSFMISRAPQAAESPAAAAPATAPQEGPPAQAAAPAAPQQGAPATGVQMPPPLATQGPGPVAGPGQPPPQQPMYGNPPGVPPAYGAPPPYPGQQPLPTAKVPLGGWLMLFFVLNAIGLGYSVLNLVLSLTGGSFTIGTLVISVGINVLPGAMILFFMLQRDIKFRPWYVFTAIVAIVISLLMLLGGISLMSVDTNMLVQAFQDPTVTSVMGTVPEAYQFMFEPDFLHTYIPIMGVGMLVGGLLAIAYSVAWWIYFYKSKRVQYTFDPRNNPPR